MSREFEEPGYTSRCPIGPCSHETPSKADCIRRMSDEELAKAILHMIWDPEAVSKLYCDGKDGCITACGEIECDEEREVRCLLRYLQAPEEGKP